MQRFQTPNRLVTDFNITNFDGAEMPVLRHGDTLQIEFSIHNPLDKPIDFQHDEMTIRIVALYPITNEVGLCRFDRAIMVLPHDTYRGRLSSIVSGSMKPGKKRLVLGLGDAVAPFVTEENFVEVMVADESD